LSGSSEPLSICGDNYKAKNKATNDGTENAKKHHLGSKF
jgi:hypothetical protein